MMANNIASTTDKTYRLLTFDGVGIKCMPARRRADIEKLLQTHYNSPEDVWTFDKSIIDPPEDIDGQKPADFIFVMYLDDSNPLTGEKLVAFRSAYWDIQAPDGGAWHLGNAAVAYKSNGLGMESLKMTVDKLM